MMTLTYPTGGAERWLEHYRPDVAAITVHRERSLCRVSAVVVAWNTPRHIIDCLDHVLAQRGFSPGEVEVLLIDNGGLEAVHAQVPARVDTEIRMVRNVGLCPARNLGVALAHAPICAFIDDDGMVEPDHFLAAERYLADPDVLAVRGRVLPRRHRYLTTLATHYDRGLRVMEDLLVTEGNSAVRRSAYLEVGGFAEGLMGGEGLDLSFRWSKMFPRGRILYGPDLVMHHDYCDDWRKFMAKSRRYRGLDETIARAQPGLGAFLSSWKASHVLPERSFAIDERVARAALRLIRKVIQVTGL